jgi:hypothetical protein
MWVLAWTISRLKIKCRSRSAPPSSLDSKPLIRISLSQESWGTDIKWRSNAGSRTEPLSPHRDVVVWEVLLRPSVNHCTWRFRAASVVSEFVREIAKIHASSCRGKGAAYHHHTQRVSSHLSLTRSAAHSCGVQASLGSAKTI